jgi:hypothetical protein
MEDMSETAVTSFVIRFTQEQEATDASPPTPWRGRIRCVQTNEEIHFTSINDALTFINNYVELRIETADSPQEDPAHG